MEQDNKHNDTVSTMSTATDNPVAGRNDWQQIFFRNGRHKQTSPFTRMNSIYGGLLLLLVFIIIGIYYLYHPYVEVTADTPGYLGFVDQLRTTGNPINVFRLPTYPLFILLIETVAGKDNLFAVSLIQGILYVVATMELYILVLWLFKRTWLAFCLGVLMGTNIIMISYSKDIMTEGLSLWLLLTIVLLATRFCMTEDGRLFKWLALLLACLFFTRPEWAVYPFLLFGYLVLYQLPKSRFRATLRRALWSSAVLALLLGGYILGNFVINQYLGLTYVENMNLIGKVMQYQMQNEAPPEYESTRRIIDLNVRQTHLTPYQLVDKYPELGQEHARPLGDFARAIIWRHPVEFGLKSVPLFFASLTSYYPVSVKIPPAPGPQHGWTERTINTLNTVQVQLYQANALFPYCGVLWLILLCWPRTRRQQSVQAMGLIILTVSFGLVLTTLGGYFLSDEMRVHIVFDPLILLTDWGTLLVIVDTLFRWSTLNMQHRSIEHLNP